MSWIRVGGGAAAGSRGSVPSGRVCWGLRSLGLGIGGFSADIGWVFFLHISMGFWSAGTFSSTLLAWCRPFAPADGVLPALAAAPAMLFLNLHRFFTSVLKRLRGWVTTSSGNALLAM